MNRAGHDMADQEIPKSHLPRREVPKHGTIVHPVENDTGDLVFPESIPSRLGP